MITLSSMIDALINHHQKILYRVPVMREVKFIKDEEVKLSPMETELLDMTPYIIKALNTQREEIAIAEQKARESRNILEQYKKEHTEFENYKRFIASNR